jgi:hypothetical protein
MPTRSHKLLDRAGDPNQVSTLHGPIHKARFKKELTIEEQVFDMLTKYGGLAACG